MEPQTGKYTILTSLLAVIVSAVVTGGVVYAVLSNHNAEVKTGLQTQIDDLKAQLAKTQVAVAIPSATPDPTADWKTYDFSDARVSFKYPSAWGTATLNHGSANTGSSPFVTFSGNSSFSLGTQSKDFAASRGAINHEIALQTILSANNNCQSIVLNTADTLQCAQIISISGATGYYVGNLGSHVAGPGPEELLAGYVLYPGTYNFADLVMTSTNNSQQSEDLVKQVLATITFE